MKFIAIATISIFIWLLVLSFWIVDLSSADRKQVMVITAIAEEIGKLKEGK